MTVSRDPHEADRQLLAAISALGRRFLFLLVTMPLMAALTVFGVEHLSHPPSNGNVGPYDWSGMWPRPTGMTLGLAAFGVGTSVSLFIATTLSNRRTPGSGPMDRAVPLVATWLTVAACALIAAGSWTLVPGGLLEGRPGVGPSLLAAVCAVVATWVAALSQPIVDSIRVELVRTHDRLSRLRASDPLSEGAPPSPDRGWLAATFRIWRGYPWSRAAACAVLLSLSFSVGLAVVEPGHLNVLMVVVPFTAAWVVYSGWRLAAGRASKARSPRLGWMDRTLGLLLILLLGATVTLVLTYAFGHEWFAWTIMGVLALLPPLAWRAVPTTKVRRFVSLAFAREIGAQERFASSLTRRLATLEPTRPAVSQSPPKRPRTNGHVPASRALRRSSRDTNPSRRTSGKNP